MKNSNLQIFKSKFCQWANETLPHGSARKFTDSLNRVLGRHLYNCDNLLQIKVRDLEDADGIRFSLIHDETIVGPNQNGEVLFVGTIMPSWDRGLRAYCNDENVYDLISWFFHFAAQYVARSRTIDVLSGINLVYGRTCSYNGNQISTKLIPKSRESKEKLIIALNEMTRVEFYQSHNRREKSLLFWIDKINSLDLYINRIFFNYINACKLIKAGFGEEAVTSLDKTVDVVQQYGRERMNINESADHRGAVLTALGMNNKASILLRQLYDIRNMFGGHPSNSKWWDFHEIFEGEFDSFFYTVKQLIMKVVQHENNNRLVEKHPLEWSQWFKENADMLWNAVWFEQIKKI